jgi:hypothetical protein
LFQPRFYQPLENVMTRRFALIGSTLLLLLASAAARTDDAALLGNWRLKSFVREVTGSGERYDQLGAHPDGYINYTADGRMFAFFVAEGQPRPAGDVPSCEPSRRCSLIS